MRKSGSKLPAGWFEGRGLAGAARVAFSAPPLEAPVLAHGLGWPLAVYSVEAGGPWCAWGPRGQQHQCQQHDWGPSTWILRPDRQPPALWRPPLDSSLSL